MSIDMLKNLQIKANVQLVIPSMCPRTRKLPDRTAAYLTDLGKRIEKEGLTQPILLAVGKIT